MKAFKQILTVFACSILTLVLATNATAQDRKEEPKDPEKKAKKQTMMMTEKLDLNKEQKKEVHEINMEFAEQSYELKREMKGEGDHEELKMRHKKMKEKKETELKEILNEEQMQRYDEMRERKHKKEKGLKRDKRKMEEDREEKEEMEESEDY